MIDLVHITNIPYIALGKISESLILCETRNETRELHGFNSRLVVSRDFKCHLTALRRENHGMQVTTLLL